MPITPQTLRLLQRLRINVGNLTDNAVRDLTRAWLAAWDRLTPSWQAAVADLVAWAQQHQRWPNPIELTRQPAVQQAAAATEDELDALAAATTAAVIAGAVAAITATAEAEPAIIGSQAPPADQDDLTTRAGRVILPSALDVISVRVQQAIVAQTRPLSPDALDAVRRELVRGIAVGTNPNDAARRMVARVNGAFEGGLTRATVIARTEMLSAYREAARYVHNANADILGGWMWIATVTGKSAARTCPSCWAMHGRVFDDLASRGPDDHQQGRCARLPVVKPWRSLGFDVPEPEHAVSDGEALFMALPEPEQLEIMGAARLALLRAGSIRWSDLPLEHPNDAWRRSFIPRPVRDLQRLATLRRRAMS